MSPEKDVGLAEKAVAHAVLNCEVDDRSNFPGFLLPAFPRIKASGLKPIQ